MVKKILPAGSIAVLYLRMSDDRQERSIGDQRAELIAYAEKHGYQILREYVDPGISGDDTARRTGFLKMREDAAKGEFSIVLCWDQDRFGRFDPIEGGHWILPFRNAGVRLETVAQGKIDWTDFNGRLVYLVAQEGKHAYLRDLSRNSIRGSIAKAKERKGTDGSCPFGWRTLDGVRVVVPAQAKIVRRIFSEYLKPGGSQRSIANNLNADGIPSPTGKKWASTTIRAILRNKKHCGTFVWGKTSIGRYFGNQGGEIVPRRKGDGATAAEPIVHEKTFEEMIDEKTFAAAQKLMEQRKRDTSPIRSAAGSYPLSGLLRCAHCGATLVGRTERWNAKRQYRCSTYHLRGKAACTANTIEEAPLLACVTRLIADKYLDDQALARLRKKIEERLLAGRQVGSIDPKRLRQQIAEIDRQIDQGTDRVFTAPEGMIKTLYAKLEKLRIERERLQSELTAATSGKASSANERQEQLNTIDEAIAAIKDLRQAVQDADPADTPAAPLVARLQDRATVQPKPARKAHPYGI